MDALGPRDQRLPLESAVNGFHLRLKLSSLRTLSASFAMIINMNIKDIEYGFHHPFVTASN